MIRKTWLLMIGVKWKASNLYHHFLTSKPLLTYTRPMYIKLQKLQNKNINKYKEMKNKNNSIEPSPKNEQVSI